MYRTRMRAVIWFLFVFVFYLFYDSYFSLFLIVSSVAMLLFLAFSIRMYKNKVQISIVAPETINKREASECYIEAKNQSFLPIVKVKCNLKIINSLTNEISNQEIYFSLNGKSKERIYIDVKSLFCGNVKMSVETVNCFDLLGLFFTIDYPKVSEEMLVLPNIFDMDVDLFENKSKNNEAFAYSSELVGMNSSEIFGIKPYVPGDNIKNIHWKLSSKFDELIMKELSETADHSLLVLLDTSLSDGNQNHNPVVFDAMMEAFLSVSRALLEGGQSHSIGWLNGKGNELQIEKVFSQNHVLNLIKMIISIERVKQEESALDFYFEKNEHTRFSQIVYITSQQGDKEADMWGRGAQVITLRCVTLSGREESTVNEGGVVFTPESMKKDLRQLVI